MLIDGQYSHRVCRSLPDSASARAGSVMMKKFMIAATLTVLAVLYVGYYEALEDGDIETVVFIKKHPTFQVKFYNIHANDGEIRRVERLSEEERKLIVDYCWYRLGVDTELKVQDDVEACRRKQ